MYCDHKTEVQISYIDSTNQSKWLNKYLKDESIYKKSTEECAKLTQLYN